MRGVDRILAEKLYDLFGIRATARILITGDEEEVVEKSVDE